MISSYIPYHSAWRKYRYRTIWCWFQAKATRGLWLLACGWSQCALPYCLLFLIPAWRQSGKMKWLWDPLSTIRYLMWTTLYIFDSRVIHNMLHKLITFVFYICSTMFYNVFKARKDKIFIMWKTKTLNSLFVTWRNIGASNIGF